MQEQLPENTNQSNTNFYPEKRTLEEALAYDYDFSITDVLAQAWSKTHGIKLVFFVAFLIITIFNTIATVFLEIVPDQMALILNIFLTVAMSGLSASFATIALKHLRGEKRIDVIQCFQSLPNVYITLVIAAVISTLFVIFGFFLLIIPGIYLSVCYCLIQWIIVDNPGITVWQALEASRKLVTRHWFKFFGLFIVLTLILIVSIIPLGIGLIWTFPLTILSMGVIYQTIFEKSHSFIV